MTFADDIGTVQFTPASWHRNLERALPDDITPRHLDQGVPNVEELGEHGNRIVNARRTDGGRYTCRVEDESGAVAEDSVWVVVKAISQRTGQLYDMNANHFGTERFNRWTQRGLKMERELRMLRYDRRTVSRFIESLHDRDLHEHLAEKWDEMLRAMQCVAWKAWLRSPQGRDATHRMELRTRREGRNYGGASRAFLAKRSQIDEQTRQFWSSITLEQFAFWFRPRAVAAPQWHPYRKLLMQQLADSRPCVETRALPEEQRGAWLDRHTLVHKDITPPSPMYPWIRPSERDGVGINYEHNAPRREAGKSYTLEELEFFYLAQRYDGARGIPRLRYPWVFDASAPKGPGLELTKHPWIEPPRHRPRKAYHPPRWVVRREPRELVEAAREHAARARHDFARVTVEDERTLWGETEPASSFEPGAPASSVEPGAPMRNPGRHSARRRGSSGTRLAFAAWRTIVGLDAQPDGRAGQPVPASRVRLPTSARPGAGRRHLLSRGGGVELQ